METTSGLHKTPTGIFGFDEMTYGGLPYGRSTLIIGPPGSGKTVFALQTLVHGAQQHSEPGIFVAFEEKVNHIKANSASFGWNLTELEKQKLLFIDAHLPVDTIQAGNFDLNGILVSLEAKVAEMGAKRVVFDALDVLLMLLEDPAAERREIYRLNEWLTNHDLTGIITAKLDQNTRFFPDRYGFLQFMVDCVVELSYSLQEQISTRKLRVIKYRGSGFVETQAPLLIDAGGIILARPDPLITPGWVPDERVSTGVSRLDAMLSGGYYRGSNILITGVPGTAKTTLGGAFATAACKRGEPTLYVTFDERMGELVRNLTSVNIDLAPHLESGLLQTLSAYTAARSAEAHLLTITKLIEEHEPQCIVLDPVSALLKVGDHSTSTTVAQRLLHLTKSKNITAVCTSLLASTTTPQEGTDLEVSTLADTWIHLGYQAQSGERNRSLSIIKSRGTKHSNQVRELILSEEGISLADVYTAGGEVLMGTLRWEKEEEEKRARVQEQRKIEHEQRELELTAVEIQTRIELLKHQMAATQLELQQLAQKESRRAEIETEREERTRQLRRGDPEEGE